MLRELRIKNLAIIDDLAVRFGPGLNVLTGETGAGKSIIVDALGLALGDRAQSDFLKSGAREGSVQAYFELPEKGNLPDLDIDLSEGLMLRRVISSGGKSRAYINDTMVTSQTLGAVGEALVDILSQHEHQSLLKPQHQLSLLDSFGRLQEECRRVADLAASVRDLVRERDGLMEQVRNRAHRLDLLSFQTGEISSAGLRRGELEELTEERSILANLARLNELSEAAHEIIYGADGSASEQLSKAAAYLREMSSYDPGAEEALKAVEAALPFVDDAVITLRGLRDRYDIDPGRLNEVEERIELIRRLQRKYGDSIEAVLAYGEEAGAEMRGLQASDARLDSVEEDLKAARAELAAAAEDLSAKRTKTAHRLERLVAGSLKELSLGNAVFRIELRREHPEDGGPRITSQGMDSIEFLFSANPGEPPRPLAKIISGGELSRVMLALRSILADVDRVAVLIFDEVDAGIGGQTAGSVGRKLGRLAEKRQVLCITHQPQIASIGDVHLMIRKTDRAGKVAVEVKELGGRERRDEIARMLSGAVTEISLRHAGELLERVK